ncbi:hypothetical protein BKA70DRAFT_1231143 [Coprinopsis sp. MPI-PUGE-AT-0042]|nr:hypothetical protein BKA70DRAFT_1231143 [Coprinopsis sp. MPI-PUGE-AT-0042]
MRWEIESFTQSLRSHSSFTTFYSLLMTKFAIFGRMTPWDSMQWSLTKFIFFFIRYFTVVFQFSIQFIGTPLIRHTHYGCYVWNIYQGIGSLLIIAAVDRILLLRASSTLQKVIAYCIGLALAVPLLEYDEFCVITKAPTIFALAAGGPIIFQIILFILTAISFVKAVKSGYGNVPILLVVIRDGTWAFALLFVILIGELVLVTLASDAYSSILYAWLNTVFSFCGYRILLNLTKMAETTSRADSAFMTGTNMDFFSSDGYSFEDGGYSLGPTDTNLSRIARSRIDTRRSRIGR